MGIKNLWQLLSPVGRSVSIETLSGKVRTILRPLLPPLFRDRSPCTIQQYTAVDVVPGTRYHLSGYRVGAYMTADSLAWLTLPYLVQAGGVVVKVLHMPLAKERYDRWC